MTRNSKLKIASLLIATSIVAPPIATALASGGDHRPWQMSDDDRGDGPKFRDHDRDHHKGMYGKHGMRRSTPLTVEEAKILVDAMLLRRGTTELKTGDVKSVDDGEEIEVTLLNANGDVVDTVSFDAKSGRPDRDEMRDMHRMMPKPDAEDRFDRRFTTEQMTLLANAMVIRFGGGELTLGEIKETPRGTYIATITNKAGDIVREMELSRVTGRPVS
ncbi:MULTISPECIES: hypothetical protein [Thalassospira]|nr:MULTISPECIES: hypothetical protein [Thalassospira]AJD52647.1 hypothetical protein TH3_12655 [Thalassospira xiamenensis M-5 = DSM 17429]SIT22966.1 hypothetical protein SAMN02744133_1096 [Thalassospira xiamenensis M-5 = DSM 17429]